MREHEKETAQTRVKRRGPWQISRDTSGNDETVNQFTMLLIGAAAFFTGLWALICLVKAFLTDGPLSILGQMAAAVIGH